MLPWSAELAGRIDHNVIESQLLRGNPLGDPSDRPLWVYTPPGYLDSDQRYPAVYMIQGYTGYVSMWANRVPFRQPFIETADAVFASGEAPGCIVVYVDAWTAYGGSQFVDSRGTGPYHSYLCDEVVPWVDARYRTIAARESRAIAGKSSGGFGAMITPMLRPDLFGALATHAGDTLYELCYIRISAARRGICANTTTTSATGGTTSGRVRRSPKTATRPAVRAGLCRLLLARPGRYAGAAVRPAVRCTAAGGVAAVAGLGPGTDGRPVRR